MCQAAVEIALQIAIVSLICFGHFTSLWIYEDNTQGGVWQYCPPQSKIPNEWRKLDKICGSYNEAVAKNYSHNYSDILVARGFILAGNIISITLLLLLIVGVSVHVRDCSAIAPAIFQLCFVIIAPATATHGFITS